MTYSEKLKDPRWQKKRLEIMQRDEFTCQHCGDKDATLNVHHKHYKRKAAPWEYEDCLLLTLCEVCHGELEEAIKSVAFFMANSWWHKRLTLEYTNAIDSCGTDDGEISSPAFCASLSFSSLLNNAIKLQELQAASASHDERVELLKNLRSDFTQLVKEAAVALHIAEELSFKALMSRKEAVPA